MNSNRQEYNLLNQKNLLKKIYSLLDETHGINIKINNNINELGQKLLNIDPTNCKIEKDIEIEYFTSLPGQKILVIDNKNNCKNYNFLDWLKYYKFSWYCTFFSFDKETNSFDTDNTCNLKKIQSSELNKKPSTRSKIKSNAIFLDQYNNPVIFIYRQSLNPKILYFKINNIEFSELSFNFCYKIINSSIVDKFFKQILTNVNSFNGSNIADALKEDQFKTELSRNLINLSEVTTFLHDFKILLDVVSKHYKVVNVSNKYNNLIKKHKLLEETLEKDIKNFKKIENDYNELDRKYENLLKSNNEALNLNLKMQKYHSDTSKENLNLKKEIISYEKNIKSLRSCNTLYFMFLFMIIITLLILDLVLKPNKVELYNRVLNYMFYKINEFSNYYEL